VAAGRGAATSPLALVAFGVFAAAIVFALMHDGHYRERRLQMIEGRLATVEDILSGKHGRTA
jgi:hypothetical protein